MFRGIERRFRKAIKGGKIRKTLNFYADGLGVKGRSLDQFSDPRFEAAWAFAFKGNKDAWNEVPDIRWRAHTCIWAAQHALQLDGDFVECGVNAGLLSMSICHYLEFEKLDRTFWLYDTYSGIPTERLSGAERVSADSKNDDIYFDCYHIAKQNFAPYPNAKLVRGFLPDTIGDEPKRIAYLSIDLNSETFERQAIERLWSRIVPGAIIVIDDYGFKGHERQRYMWDEFAIGHGLSILSVPTGQGLLIKAV